MADDLPPLVRAAYNNATMSFRDATEAFDRAVKMVMKRRPLLGEDQAREEVAMMLGFADTSPRGDDEAA